MERKRQKKFLGAYVIFKLLDGDLVTIIGKLEVVQEAATMLQ
jgi:hypothetical protein